MPVQAVDLRQVSCHILRRRVRLLFREDQSDVNTVDTHARTHTNILSTHSSVPDPHVSIVTGRQQVLVLPVPLDLRRPGWIHQTHSERMKQVRSFSVLECTRRELPSLDCSRNMNRFSDAHQQQTAPPWVSECPCRSERHDEELSWKLTFRPFNSFCC